MLLIYFPLKSAFVASNIKCLKKFKTLIDDLPLIFTSGKGTDLAFAGSL